MYFYDISYIDQFWGYWVDYVIYGMIYPMAGFETDFFEINFEPADILCYELNGYDPTDANPTLPTYS